MTVTVSLPLFLALTVLASVGLGYVCCVIADSLAEPDPPWWPDVAKPTRSPLEWMNAEDWRPENADDWWSEDDVTATLHEIREL